MRPIERLRRDADDRERAAVESHRATDNRWITTEPRLPASCVSTITGRVATRTPFIRLEAANRRLHSEQREVVVGDRAW